jgi:hypothetical protein
MPKPLYHMVVTPYLANTVSSVRIAKLLRNAVAISMRSIGCDTFRVISQTVMAETKISSDRMIGAARGIICSELGELRKTIKAQASAQESRRSQPAFVGQIRITPRGEQLRIVSEAPPFRITA